MLADETYRVGYFVRLATTLLKDEENAQENHVPACNFAKYLRFYKITDRLSNKPILICLLTTPPQLKYTVCSYNTL